ncbi:DUF3272 family protein [Lactococcus hodotermopsidis]|uniref:DUF3272 family protein n=1 Tax=Pseudolactococcus hodotermopsidis TaxID=2709157 RepID=UPI00155263C4|nr:DUF3272 family protein [Lactococcus hodotermopsidis]
MIKQHFYVFIAGTLFYAWFFADSLLSGKLFLAGFWLLFLLRKLRIAHRADQWIRSNGKAD